MAGERRAPDGAAGAGRDLVRSSARGPGGRTTHPGWVDGVALDRVPRRSWPEVAATLLPVAEELAALHARGWVHGDVSPGNVVLRPDGGGALVDFGCSAPVGLARATGTPGFVAPEVEAGSPVTPAADVYALAAVARAATTGSGPDLGAALAGDPLARPADLVALFAASADPRVAVTRDYGPGPGAPAPAPAPRSRSRTRAAVAVAAAVLAVAALLGAVAGLARAAERPGGAVPPVASP